MTRLLTLGALCAFYLAPVRGAADAPPLRHLVYSFSFSVTQNGEVTNEPGIGGKQTYSGGLNDMGTITVDAVREQPDRGLVVTIGERAQNGRNANPATCVVYGNTNVICDPDAKINLEEQSLLRFLGVKFVDPNQIDAKNHWQIAEDDPAMKLRADYTIASNANGVMTIREQRNVVERGAGAIDSNIQSTVVYDENRLLPVSIEEYDVEREYGGLEATATSTFQTTLKLVSDSMAKP